MLHVVRNEFRPRFSNTITRFFEGDCEAAGVIVDRFGRLRRMFSGAMRGRWSGDRFVLDEEFVFDDGESDHRRWTLELQSDRCFTARCADVVGFASGRDGQVQCRMSYRFKLPVGGRIVGCRFDDRMYQIDGRTMANRAVIYLFGIRIAEITATFWKCDETRG